MDKAKLVQKLNQAIALELCALLTYNQYSQVLMGPDRRIWREFFKETSDHGLKDARTFGARVVALGGVPTVEPAPVRQASHITDMLTNALEIERQLVQVYSEALEIARDNAAYRNLLEEQVLHEQTDVEEIEKYLDRVVKVAAAPAPAQQASRTA
jgi:bacterioferritin